MELLTKLHLIIVTFFVLMCEVAQSMFLIQSSNVGKAFLSGNVYHIWANFWDSWMSILLLWQMSFGYEFLTSVSFGVC